MSRSDFVSRLATSAALAAMAVAFLVFFGPGMPLARADVWAPLLDAAGFLAPPPGPRDPAVTGTVLVNGQTFHYRSGRSPRNVRRVLDEYERQFLTTIGAGRALQPAARVEGHDFGIVSGFRLPRATTAGDVDGRFRRFFQTTKLSELGTFHMVAAFAGEHTLFIEFVAGHDVRLDRLMPAGAADAPGDDLDGVRRPAALQRYLTVEHGDGPAASRTWVYRAVDGRSPAAEFQAALRGAGWTPNPALAARGVSHFTDGRRECVVGDGGGRGDAAALVLLVCRSNQTVRVTR